MTNEMRSTEVNQPIYLGLGSNVGDRQANLREAVAQIEKLGVEVVSQSSIYETEPVGFKDQPWFLNQVIELRVDLDVAFGDVSMAEVFDGTHDRQHLDFASSLWAHDLFKALQRIEREMGRQRTIPDGPRVIDIDVLICGNQQGFWAETHGSAMAKAGPAYLSLPHPRMHERRFVLEPLCEIAPEVIHPVLKQTCREILASLDDPSIVRLYDPAPVHS
jgi:2-amino-4-hydroxy-6-hydroxymethyldihydropteridine diphosphokinase